MFRPSLVAAGAWQWWSAPNTPYWSVLVAVGWLFAAFLRIWHKQAQIREFGSVQAKLEQTLEDIAGYATGGKTRPVVQVAGPPQGTVLFTVFNHGQYPLQNLAVSVWRMQKTGRDSAIGHIVVDRATISRIDRHLPAVIEPPAKGVPLGVNRFQCTIFAANGWFMYEVYTFQDGKDFGYAVQTKTPGGETTYDVGGQFPGVDHAKPQESFERIRDTAP